MADPIVSSSFPKLFDKRIRDIREGVWQDLTKEEGRIDALFNVMPSDSAYEEFAEVGAVPDIPAFYGILQSLSVYPGYYKKIEPAEYGAKLVWERKFLDDKKFAVMEANSKQLFISAQKIWESIMIRFCPA